MGPLRTISETLKFQFGAGQIIEERIPGPRKFARYSGGIQISSSPLGPVTHPFFRMSRLCPGKSEGDTGYLPVA